MEFNTSKLVGGLTQIKFLLLSVMPSKAVLFTINSVLLVHHLYKES